MSIPALEARPTPLVVRVGVGSRLVAEEVGGKGASLDRLTRSGLAVPAAFVVTAAAFRAQLESVAGIEDLVANLPEPAAREAIFAALVDAPILPTLAREIAAALAALARDHEAAIATGQAAPGMDRDAARDPIVFAVRSSALDEDGATASFAGLHETELGLTADEVDPAIRRCWLSLWSAPAIAYRTRRGLPVRGLAMAVVVQVLVAADASAVLFTRHPVTGRTDQVLLTAIRGLGEPMVSGEATPETLVVDRATRQVVERMAGRPGPRSLVVAGRIVERHDPSPEAVLTAQAVADLVDVGLEVEAAAGSPVDIEAALVGSTWFLLQSRPITT